MKSISACHREEGFISEYRNEHQTEINLCAGYKIQYAHLMLHFADGLAFYIISEKSSTSCKTRSNIARVLVCITVKPAVRIALF